MTHLTTMQQRSSLHSAAAVMLAAATVAVHTGVHVAVADEAPPVPPAGGTEVIIIGAGWSGMSAAHHLAQVGLAGRASRFLLLRVRRTLSACRGSAPSHAMNL